MLRGQKSKITSLNQQIDQQIWIILEGTSHMVTNWARELVQLDVETVVRGNIS